MWLPGGEPDLITTTNNYHFIYPFALELTIEFVFTAPSGSPLNLNVRTIDSMTIELAWSEPLLETQNGIIISYIINISVSNTKTSFVINAMTAAPLNITELHPYYGYSLRVAAVTSQGVGPFSEPVSVTTPEDGELVIFLPGYEASRLHRNHNILFYRKFVAKFP